MKIKGFDDRLEFRITQDQARIIKKIVKICSYEYDNNLSIFIRAWIIKGINFHKKNGDIDERGSARGYKLR